MKKDSPVKKHHFWILFGVVPLVTLIGVIVVDAKVGSKIEDRQKEIEAAKSDIGKKSSPKPVKLIDQLDKVAAQVEKKQGDLHKENWDRQKALFTWPRNSDVFKELERRQLPFGSPLPDLTALHGEFQRAETYQHEYSSAALKRDGSFTAGTGMADMMAPTQFRGGWQSVLRYVNDFGQVFVTKEQVWLLLEDMWVQRSLLSGLRGVNLDMANFEEVRPDPAKAQEKTKKKLFRNRIWELELDIVPEGTNGRQKLTGTLTNVSDRLQLMGKSMDGGNGMALHVWLSADPNAQPVLFKIGGEFLPGRTAMKTVKDKDGVAQTVPANVLPIVPIDDHILPPGTDPARAEIVRVEQVYDIRTVPLKRIDMMVVGHQAAVDARSVGQLAAGLVPPLSTGNGGLFSEAFTKDPNAVDPNAPPGTGPVGSGGPGTPPAPVGLGGPRGGGGLGGGIEGGPGATGTGAAAKPVGGGPLTAVIDGNKKRYLAVTQQVRRMPVAVVVVVDQAYIQDVLLSLSNSPLRFQITQVNWARFRDTLEGLGMNAGGSGSGSLEIGSGPSSIGGEFGRGGGDPDVRGSGPMFRPGGGATGLPPGIGVPGPGMPMMGGPGYPGGGSGSSVVTEAQITSGLVELSVYGVVSLYEAPKAPAPDAATDPKTGNTPAPNTPAPNPPAPNAPTPNVSAPNTPTPSTPAPNTPAPNAPMPMAPSTPTPPKMRRRVRA